MAANPSPPASLPKPRLAAAAFALLILPLAFRLAAQNDPTTGQPIFQEPPTVVPSMNGGAVTVLRAVYDDQMMPRLVRKADGTTATVEEMALTHTWDGRIPGQTFRVMPGERLPITVENRLQFDYSIDQLLQMKILGRNDGDVVKKFIQASMNITNLHVHGLHVSPQGLQDNVLLHANPGKDIPYSYDIPKQHAPGTHWYHPHNHGSTSLQVTQGMVGALIVGEPPGQNLTPAGWNALERLLVVRANSEPAIIEAAAFADPAMARLAEAAADAADGLDQPEDINEIVAALKARIGGGGSNADGLLDQLARGGQLERILQAAQEILEPPTFTVNGQLDPVGEVAPGQLVRLRLINAGSRVRDYKEFFLEGHELFLAAMDGINLKRLPRATGQGSYDGFVAYSAQRKLSLAPGNRADLYFIAKDVGRYRLVAESVPRADQQPQSTQDLMTFEVRTPDFRAKGLAAGDYDSELTRFVRALDANLLRLQGTGPYQPGGYLAPIAGARIDAERTVVFDVKQGNNRPFFVNERSYNANEAPPVASHETAMGGHDPAAMPGMDDYLGKAPGDGGKGPRGQTPWPIRRGTVEKWVIRNNSPNRRHPFHIHVSPAWVVGITENGKPVPADDPRLNRWQDTIDLPPAVGGVPGEVTVLQRFDDYEGLFVLHCHILQHEDRGMMINVLIMPPDDDDKDGYFASQMKANEELNRRING